MNSGGRTATAPGVAQAATSGGVSAWRRYRPFLRGLTSFALILVAWEISARYFLTNRLFFAPVSQIVETAVALLRRGELQTNIYASLSAVMYGMILATIFGIVIGVALGASSTIRDYVEPVLTVLYAMPLVAVAPLLILWFGVGVASKIAVVFLMAIFPIAINTSAGILNTDPEFLEVAKAFHATRMQLIVKVMAPAAVPFVVTGLRLAVGRSVVGVTVGELFGAKAGLGFMIFTAGQTFDTPTLFVGIITLALIGMGLTLAIRGVEIRISGWKKRELE